MENDRNAIITLDIIIKKYFPTVPHDVGIIAGHVDRRNVYCTLYLSTLLPKIKMNSLLAHAVQYSQKM